MPATSTAPCRLRHPRPSLLPQARDEMRQAHDVVGAQRLGGDRHGAVEIRGRLRLEAAQQLEEVVEVLAGEARRLLLADEPGLVAGRAMVNLREALPLGDL